VSFLKTAVFALAAFAVTGCADDIVVKSSGRAPNIILVLTDDEPVGMTGSMPMVSELSVTGTEFTDYTVSDPLCCPSRATILRGQYHLIP
jgi:arylsulfatase A-like enzyme